MSYQYSLCVQGLIDPGVMVEFDRTTRSQIAVIFERCSDINWIVVQMPIKKIQKELDMIMNASISAKMLNLYGVDFNESSGYFS